MNPIYYSQPEFYHFSRDSIELADEIVVKFKHRKELHILDVFAGCGVVGIEVALKQQRVKSLTLVEKNESFEKHLKSNIESLRGTVEVNYNICDFLEYKIPSSINLIVANPPYYLIGKGREPVKTQKRDCHFIDENKWEQILDKLIESKAEVFLLARPNLTLLKRQSVFQSIKKLSGGAEIMKLNKTFG